MNIFKSKERKRQEKLLDKFVSEHTYPREVNMYPKPCDAQEALNFLEELILGTDWYIVDPLPNIVTANFQCPTLARIFCP